MYKTLGIAVVLMAAFVFTSSNKPAGASPTTPISAPIVARGKLLNQTAPIPTTTILTPTQSGLYRLSVYGTLVTSATNSSSAWFYNPEWTDDSGILSQNAVEILQSNDNSQGTFTWTNVNSIGASIVIEAKGGTAITYSVTQGGPPDGTAYSLYYTLERLE